MRKYSLRAHNTFGLDVFADHFLEYHSEDELRELISEGRVTVPFLHIGQGSNLLFTGDYYRGTVLHSCIRGITVVSEDENTVCVHVGAGLVWDDFVCHCVTKGWYGVENLSLIPGETGAAAVQNIGAYGVEVKDVIVSVDTVDLNGRKRVYSVDECCYSYRHSLFKEPSSKSVFVTGVQFRLNKIPRFVLTYGALREALSDEKTLTLQAVRDAVVRIRRSKLPDPAVCGNAGSFFMNPIVSRACWQKLLALYPYMPYYEVDAERVKIPAGWLIEQCGWKGSSLGPAAVYDKQALVLVNLGGATGADIVALAKAVQDSVYQKFGISIQPEVLFVGDGMKTE